MKYQSVLAAAIVTWLAGPFVWAADVQSGNQNVTTKDVIVETNQAQEAAKEESQSTTIITREDIAAKQAKSVEEIIFNETGVSRTVDAMGRVGVSIRGAEPRHTLILVDGRPVMGDVGKFNGAGDELQRLGTENVDHIEIIRGSASAKYGTDAIGGVINVITRKPADKAGLEVNVEGRRVSGDSDVFPYQNGFVRADSGEMGKWKVALYGSKRDILPVWNHKLVSGDGSKGTGLYADKRDSLRFFGDIKNIGVSTTYEINDRNKIDFNIDKVEESLRRTLNDQMLNYKRNSERNTYNLNYSGNDGQKTDWNISVDYAKLKEDDVGLMRKSEGSAYSGINALVSLDNLEHKQWNFKASANTQVNDEHLLTYGFGYSEEEAEGTRIRNAPTSYTRNIDPWDYDKNLYSNGGVGKPASTIYDRDLPVDENGVPYYDKTAEWYGYKDSSGKAVAPSYTYEMYLKDDPVMKGAPQVGVNGVTQEHVDAFNRFADELIKENDSKLASYEKTPVMVLMKYYGMYMGGQQILPPDLTWHGKKFQEEGANRQNRITIGKAKIKKQNFYIQDLWQLNDDTTVAPILRLDHSDMFGTNATFNVGLTHHLGGKANRRLKANIGTGYTEPGIGELYYSWEMYAGMPVEDSVSRLGYWFAGNPNLKPEKSVNFDIGIEGESGKTSARFDVFHNRIKDYMTVYFTGNLIDFHPGDMLQSWAQPADMIYSFKNIGRAEITGVEAEIKQKFNDHWSGRLGYTYLHAINKSDPDMPRQLLDRPTHKVDIGLDYINKNSGWQASLWGSYYINMLDSNSLANNGNYGYYYGNLDEPKYEFENLKDKKNLYAKKTFGIWNILVQKQLSKDAKVYVGVDNIFNHHDDDRALQERVYKMGLNMKFGPDKDTIDKALDKAVGKAEVVPTLGEDWFIKAPFDTSKETGIELIGDYRVQWNSFTGKDKPSELRVTKTTSVGSALKNSLEKAEHGFEQRLRLGVDARIGDNTNVTILGSASGMQGVDTKHDVSDSRGLGKQRLDTVDVTQHANKWDFSIGRLTEPMGVTGYWFGKEYDGARAVWTSGKNQFRVGYGDFSQSTGITDSAYTHATREVFYRALTKDEFLGGLDKTGAKPNPEYAGVLERLMAAGDNLEAQQKIVQEVLDIIKAHDTLDDRKSAYETITADKVFSLGNYSQAIPMYAYLRQQTIDASGKIISDTVGTELFITNKKGTATESFQPDFFSDAIRSEWSDTYDSKYQKYVDAGSAGITKELSNGNKVVTTFYGYGTYTGAGQFTKSGTQYTMDTEEFAKGYTSMTQAEAQQKSVKSPLAWKTINGQYKTPDNVRAFLTDVYGNWEPEGDSTMPLHLMEALGYMRPVLGTVLVQDQIPPIDKAAFAQYKHQFGDNFGVQAWYLRSVGDDTHTFTAAHGDANDTASFDQLANVIGIGAAYRLGDTVKISYEWGQNRTDFGRYMNGHTVVDYQQGSTTTQDQFTFLGRESGGTPKFWVARVDIGKSDTNVVGSWNAFADYKYFEHGSFFGGNGTDSLPDRYLDGIRSFTVGAGYVPAKNLLIEGFYTFGAKGISQRDSLYGPEHFDLGDYTRLQVTYKF